MGRTQEIYNGIYCIGGPNITRSEDATVFLVDCGSELVMIDSGAGWSAERLTVNIAGLGFDCRDISTLILTHCHIDHIGGAPYFKRNFGCAIVAHELDADAIEKGDPLLTAANMYGTHFPPTPIDRRLAGDREVLRFGDDEIVCLHTPGHTPGSLSLYVDRRGKRILFGQDIHGPFLPTFGSDIEEWKKSMEKLLELEADILCEGHFGIFPTKERTRSYIISYLSQY